MVDETKSGAGDDRDVDFSQLESVSPDGDGGSSDDVTQVRGPEDLQDQVASLELSRVIAERDEFQDKYLRALADSDNIRKRSIKERSELIKYQGEQIVLDLLTVVDDFELALASSMVAPETGSENDNFRQGIEMIHKRFVEVLAKWDIRGESAIGKPFDPARHEAISRVASADVEPGCVVNELKKSFFYKDKLIRPGQVIVSVAASE